MHQYGCDFCYQKLASWRNFRIFLVFGAVNAGDRAFYKDFLFCQWK